MRTEAITAITAQVLVDQSAPRLFAVVELGEGFSDFGGSRIVAWGLAFPNGEAEIITSAGARMSLRSPEGALDVLNMTGVSDLDLLWPTPQPSGAASVLEHGHRWEPGHSVLDGGSGD